MAEQERPWTITSLRPWQVLALDEPDNGQLCEWVVLGRSWLEASRGRWVALNNETPPTSLMPIDPPAPVTARGFEVPGKGLMISDPTRTIWRPINEQP